MKEWIKGRHYYHNDSGLVVLTAFYLEQRGYCCGNGCLHCPYNYINVPEPRKTKLLSLRDNKPGETENQ